MDLGAINACLQQIDELVRGSPDVDDLRFRMRLEELVKRGGKDTENAIVHYITGTYIPLATRLNLIRMAGYIRSDAFLLPLKKVIDLGEDDLLREEAIISISKYNDRRALDMLDAALDKKLTPPLQEAVTQAIARIRHENPLLAMLPRFLSGGKNREMFEITLKIFKKILGPADAKSFIAYLQHGDQLVAEGSFEILCHRGDEAVFFFVAEYFREHGRLLERLADRRTGAERMATFIAAFHEYLRRHPDYFPQLRSGILDLRRKAGDAAWGRALDSLIEDLEHRAGARP
jgi:hypothetical protein